MLMEAEDLLNSPDYFDCERFKTRLSKQVCVDRQLIHQECFDCEQGRAMAQNEAHRINTRLKTKKLRPLSFGRRYTKKRRIVIMEENEGTLCLVDECTEPAHMRGLCKSHYSKWLKGKLPGVDPLPSKTTGKKNAKQPKEHKLAKKPVNDSRLVLDIGLWPAIRESLEEAASINIRSIEHQAIAYIVQGLKNEGYGEDKAA